MAAFQGSTSCARNWRLKLSCPDRWEAPDRGFVGHRDIVTRSLARYTFLSPHLHGAVLDVGCGRGHAIEIVESRSQTCFGIDISPAFLREARESFPTAPVVRATGDILPFPSDAFDSVIALEVIEHIESDRQFLEGLRRVAREGALIAVSTPNRLVSSGQSVRPLNHFHVREYTPAGFHRLLDRVFASVTLYGQRERTPPAVSTNRLIDLVPIRLKYLLPAHIQGLLSVALRPPLDLANCLFELDALDDAHTLLALCRA